MTEIDKRRKLEVKIQEKYPGLSAAEYEAVRNQYIRTWMKISKLFLGTGVAVIFLSMLLKFMAGIWIGGILTLGYCLKENLPEPWYDPKESEEDIPVEAESERLPEQQTESYGEGYKSVVPEETAQGERYLTVESIAAACRKEEKKTNRGILVFLCIVLIIEVITLNGLEPMEMLERILKFWFLYIPITWFSIKVIISILRNDDPVDQAIQQGKFHLICSQVNDKQEYSDMNDNDTYTLLFNCHDTFGRYSLDVSYNEYRSAHIGRPYYLVLKENGPRSMKVLTMYAADANQLDVYLTQKLREDAFWAGEPISEEERRKKWQQVEEKFTPVEEEARRPELLELERKAWLRLVVVLVTTVLFLIIGENLILGAVWYWKHLYTIVWLYACVWQLVKYLGAEWKVTAVRSRMTDYRGLAALRVLVWIVAVFSNLVNGIRVLV